MPQVVVLERPSFEPLEQEGCKNVFIRSGVQTDDVNVTLLRFGKSGTIHEHAANFDVDVVCLEGRGFTSVGSEESPIQAGQRVRWPAGQPHLLWTTDSEMVTLMVEHRRTAVPTWEVVDSSMVSAYKYDADTSQLDIMFNRVSTYRYFDVPRDVVQALRQTASKGRFVHSNILDVYEFEKLD